MIKVDGQMVTFEGTTMDLEVECMLFFKSFNQLVESGKIEIDEICACDIRWY